MSITLGYINIEGLKSLKLQACCSLLDAGLFDILFLSETLFPKNFNYMSHPYSFIHTPYSKFSDKSRPSGGLFALLSPRIRSSVQSYQVTPYGILLDIDGIKVLAVYIPPSLSHQEITSVLSSFSNYSMLFGDINVRFKGICKSNPSPHSLQDFWYGWSLASNGCSSFKEFDFHGTSFTCIQKHSSLSTLVSVSSTVGEPFYDPIHYMISLEAHMTYQQTNYQQLKKLMPTSSFPDDRGYYLNPKVSWFNIFLSHYKERWHRKHISFLPVPQLS